MQIIASVFLNKVNPRSSAFSSEVPSLITGQIDLNFDALSWSCACLIILAVRPGPTSQGARAGIKTCYQFCQTMAKTLDTANIVLGNSPNFVRISQNWRAL